MNSLLVGADAMAYAHRLSGEANCLERVTPLFRSGSCDPLSEGDANTYGSTKETDNSVSRGHVFLHEWAAQQPGEDSGGYQTARPKVLRAHMAQGCIQEAYHCTQQFCVR